MPTPRQHGGAELLHIPLVTPGFRGLNTQQSSGTLGPEWATTLSNAVVDDNGRLAARKGWLSVTQTPVAGAFVHVIEYVRSNGTTSLVGVTATKFYESVNDGDTWTDITGSLSFTDGEWQMVNFNNYIFAAQAGRPPVYYTGLGTFVEVEDDNAPTGGIIMSAFGRLWITSSDGHTLKYSALLDGTNWTTDDSGIVDHWNVWPGNDQIVAVASFNGTLVVFGRNSIVMWTDGRGSALGIDPLTMYVVDTVAGVGCRSKYALQHIGDGDLWFLSDNGIQSLGRVLRERSNPINNISKNVQDYLRDGVLNTDAALIRSVYSPDDRLFLLSLPSGGSTEAGYCVVFDTRGLSEDGAARCMGTWTGLVPRAAVVRRNGDFLSTLATTTGEVGRYTGNQDDTASYVFVYESGWFDLTNGYLLYPKRYTGVVFSSGSIDLTFKWAFDFDPEWSSRTRTFVGSAGGGEWGLGEWGDAEFGGSSSLREGKVAAAGSGKYIKLALQATISDTTLAVQQLDLYSKIGRFA